MGFNKRNISLYDGPRLLNIYLFSLIIVIINKKGYSSLTLRCEDDWQEELK